MASVQQTSVQPTAIAKWLAIFLLQLQGAYRLSNTVINHLFRFLSTLLLVISTFSSQCSELAKPFPSNLYLAKKYIVDKVKFTHYVVCRKCYNVYKFEDCKEGPSASQRTNICTFKPYPDHPHRLRRASCQTPLLKSVELIGGRRILYPFLIYCYLGVEVSVRQLWQRPCIESWCEEWRNRPRIPDTYCDVYDGKIWNEFLEYDHTPFLSEPNNLALMLNMDFFQPYKHLKNYKVGGIYCVVMNLPRAVRYKQENVLLIGLIPGPKEPDHDINSFLDPMAEELRKFWSGIVLMCRNGRSKLVKCALLCVACDLPAGRKTCGFLGHNASFGCSRCYKAFSGGFGSTDYSGFDRENWPKRDGKEHRRIGMGMRSFTTATERERQESQAGLRYSSLMKLRYFDAPRMLVVDPMHNLFLGSAKRVLHDIWMEKNILSDQQFKVIQKRVDCIKVPPGIGRIPLKIQTGFSSFTADQWKNWTLYYSLMVLYDMLGPADLECWRHFVLACRLLCQQTLSKTHLQLGDALLMRFCKKVQQLYGTQSITPNMHMHGHLKSCIEDYGPLHVFWVYAFERYNGILENIPNNNRCIEPQLMESFVMNIMAVSAELPEVFADKLMPHFSSLKSNSPDHLVGSLADTYTFSLTGDTSSSSTWEYDDTNMVLPKCRSKHILVAFQLNLLRDVYASLNSVSPSSIDNPSVCWKYTSITFKGKVLGCQNSRSRSSSIVVANWDRNLFGHPLASIVEDLVISDYTLRPVRINYFLMHRPVINGKQCTYLLAYLSWYKFHPSMLKLGKPLTVWCSSTFEVEGVHSVVPIQVINSRCVSLNTDINDENVLIVCPCVNF